MSLSQEHKEDPFKRSSLRTSSFSSLFPEITRNILFKASKTAQVNRRWREGLPKTERENQSA